MSERMIRLAEDYADQNCPGSFVKYNPEWFAFYNQKFAELIVRECAGIYDKIDNGNLHMGTDNYLEALHKTFFGDK